MGLYFRGLRSAADGLMMLLTIMPGGRKPNSNNGNGLGNLGNGLMYSRLYRFYLVHDKDFIIKKEEQVQ